jgi:hypothetical protein
VVFEKLPFLALAAVASGLTLLAQDGAGALVPISVLPLGARDLERAEQAYRRSLRAHGNAGVAADLARPEAARAKRQSLGDEERP